ncbi:MAG: nucleotidyltransferase family protein [Rhizomicrobium sp.]|nr:nucleotidyltransferase family protein [Rhizomicrobium sp.]
MSNKARLYRAINATQSFATVVVSSLLLFIGFSGPDKIRTYVSWVHPISKEATELWFNLLVFALFVIGILHLAFRFPSKQSQAEKAIASLAAFGNEIEDALSSIGNLASSATEDEIEVVRTRYEAIAEHLLANSDRDFLKAKRDVARKEAKKTRLHVGPQELFDPLRQELLVSSIVLGSRPIVDVLIALRETNEKLYLGGGLVRNAVWDFLHNYPSPTPVDDVDVVYFDQQSVDKLYDEEFNKRLGKIIPTVRWSVKNQARMHTVNNEAPYGSLAEAIAHWPETATAIIVRLTDGGKLEFVTPYGFDDLLRLVITNTEAFSTRTDVIRRRIKEKNWLTVWPRLKVWLHTDDETEKLG